MDLAGRACAAVDDFTSQTSARQEYRGYLRSAFGADEGGPCQVRAKFEPLGDPVGPTPAGRPIPLDRVRAGAIRTVP